MEMSGNFRCCGLDQLFLLPPSLQEWLPSNHLARFIAEVAEELDLSEILARYEDRDTRGRAAYHPLLLTRVLLYGYCVGVFSSRKLERATYDQVPVRYLAADQHPDHDTIAAFRQRHLEALSKLFVQVLRLCQKAGLVKLGHVAIDGTKINANASTRGNQTYDTLSRAEQYWKEQVDRLFEEAARVDRQETASEGVTVDALPEHLAEGQQRLIRIQQAKRQLEEEARLALEQAQAARISGPGKQHSSDPDEAARREREAVQQRWKRARRVAEKPTRQYNFTDPDSRLMRDGGLNRFAQSYNTQVAVDGQAQVIVAAAVTQQAADRAQLQPMLTLTAEQAGSMPQQVSADAGYWSTPAIANETRCELFVAPDASGPFAGEPTMQNNTVANAMRQKLRSQAGQAAYRMRRCVVEPVFGQIKEGRSFRRFSFRGLAKVTAEWNLVCLTHNLLKLFRFQIAPPLPEA